MIRDQLRETPEVSDRQIAGMLGVSATTVGTIRSELEGQGQLSKLDSSIGADGKTRPRKVDRAPKVRIAEADAEGQLALLSSAKQLRQQLAHEKTAAQRETEIIGGARREILKVRSAARAQST